ncbi:DNA ligase 1-like [Ptychodera flava]|uniref:DNA ligase 1-like n=1 Tax=Ptychodera flava TaxID=63121 RepID=UPI003969EF3E
MSPLKEKEDFKPPNSSPSTPEHEESKFAEFASPMKSKGRDGHVQSRLDSTKRDDTQSGKIVIEKPTSRWEYASSSDEDIENLRANSSHSSSIPLASDASLLSQHETEGSTSGSIVKNSPLPKYMQLHSPIKPTLENLECVSKSPMKAQDFFSHAGAIPNIPDPGNLSTDPTETPVIIDSVSNVQVPDLSDGESHSQGTTMTRYDRLIEESRRLREKHQRQDEAEQKRLAMLNTRYQEIKEALEQPVLEEEEMREEDDSKESGIMEEPDLTLISIETSSVASTEDIAESLMSFEQHEKQLVAESMMMKDAASLMSFEQHEKQLVAESMMMKEAKDDGDYDTISSGTLADSPHSEGTMESGTVIPLRIPIKQDSEQVSLQEAFAKRKQAFIEASKRREKEAKEKAMQSAHEIDVKILKKTTKPTGQNGKQTDKESSVEGKKSVKFSPMPEILSKPHESPVKKPTKAIMKTKTSSDRKKDEIEMKQRNLRLYNQLEEVKERKVLEERKDSYAQNREKAKEFQKKTLEMLKKKSTKAKKAT